MSSIIFATLVVTGLAAGEQVSVAGTTASDSWEQYPAYSTPPLLATASMETHKELPPPAQLSLSGERAPILGALIDAGVPDGAGVSVAFRPWYWLRAQAGATHNTISTGIRGGVTLIPFYFWITPSLTFEAGHFFPGDATWIVHKIDPSVKSSLLQHVGYDYGNAQLGFEIGSPSSVSFFVRGGITYLQTSISGVQQAIQDSSIQAKDLNVTGTFPSAKLGLIIYFL